MDGAAPVEVSDDLPGETGSALEDDVPVGRRWLPSLSSAWTAVLVWVVAAPIAAVAVRVVDTNPLSSRGALLPLALGLPGVVLLAALAVRFRHPMVPGLAAGVAATWVELCLVSGMLGTPFGDSGLRGDAGRLTALVTRYTVTLNPVDAFVPSVPTEYPPLFPWGVARVADVTGRPGWALLGDAEALLLSLTVLIGFVLWQRLVPAWPAVLLALAAPLAFAQPRKAYETFAMAVLVPLALATLCRFRRPGGLGWLPAGLLLGLLLQVYQGYLIFTAGGLLALAVGGWRAAGPERRDYLLHLVRTGLTALVVAGWYLVPFLYGLLVIGGPRVNDSYIAGEITSDPLGVQRLIGGDLPVLKVLGLFGLLLLRGRRWWAGPLLGLMAGAYVYRLLFLLIFVGTGHTGYLDYTGRIIAALLYAGAILTVWSAGPVVARRLPRRPPRGLGVVAGAVLAAVAMSTLWQQWTPTPIGMLDTAQHPVSGSPNLMTFAHAEPLPDGSLPRYRPKGGPTVEWFPVAPIEDAVHRTLGADARPVTLSYSERLFAFLPWPGYNAFERQASNTYLRWDERTAELRRLSALADPVAFANDSQRTRFGRVDVFVLRGTEKGWEWGPVTFAPALFDTAHWDVHRLPNHTVLAIRR